MSTERKLLYIVSVLYRQEEAADAGPVYNNQLSLQLGHSLDECREKAQTQAALIMTLLGAGWEWVMTTAHLVTPQEIERLNNEAGTTAIALWPDEIPG